MRVYSLILVFLLGGLIPVFCVAEEAHHHGLKIPADIKPLLTQEMLAVEKGMQELLSSIAKGDWDKIAGIAKQIEASYIMKQSLTAEQMQQLHHSLPEQFIRQDRAFHGYAGMLAHAAKAKIKILLIFIFIK